MVEEVPKKKKRNIVKRHPALFIFLLIIFLSLSSFFLLTILANRGVQRYFAIINDFEKDYIENKYKSFRYNLITTIDFEFSGSDSEPLIYFSDLEQPQKHIYSGTNENDSEAIIFSFLQCNAPISYNIVVTDTEGNEKFYSGGFSHIDKDKILLVNTAASIDIKQNYSYKLYYEYDGETQDAYDSVYGKVNIYEKIP